MLYYINNNNTYIEEHIKIINRLIDYLFYKYNKTS